MLKIVSRKVVGADNREEVLKLVEKMVAYTIKTHKGCIEYTFNKKKDGDEEYVFLEKWDTKEDFELHMSDDKLINMGKEVNALCKATGGIEEYEELWG